MAKKPGKRQIPELLARLRERYGRVTCALEHRNAYELISATILSAQCTDKRVNLVTPALFARYPTPTALAKARQEDVEELVRTTGFYRNKAKSLIGMARAVVSEHGGEIPRTMEELLELPGVARKTANVVLGVAFGIPSGVVVDTHVARIAGLLGLTEHTDPVKIERDLMELVPQSDWIELSHLLIHHGRAICIARRPRCDECPVNALCASAFDPEVGYRPPSKTAAPRRGAVSPGRDRRGR